MSWEWECRLEIVFQSTSRVLYAHGVIERPLLLDK